MMTYTGRLDTDTAYGSGRGKHLLPRGDTTTPRRLRILPVVGRDHHTVRERAIVIVTGSMRENGRGRVLRRLVVRVDVTSAMEILLRIGKADRTTGGRERGARNMNIGIGREIREMGKEKMLLTGTGVERRMSV